MEHEPIKPIKCTTLDRWYVADPVRDAIDTSIAVGGVWTVTDDDGHYLGYISRTGDFEHQHDDSYRFTARHPNPSGSSEKGLTQRDLRGVSALIERVATIDYLTFRAERDEA